MLRCVLVLVLLFPSVAWAQDPVPPPPVTVPVQLPTPPPGDVFGAIAIERAVLQDLQARVYDLQVQQRAVQAAVASSGTNWKDVGLFVVKYVVPAVTAAYTAYRLGKSNAPTPATASP